ncbi:hypothetical protein PMAYCL1PPCAC_28867, partial [Pristionchus mayeri]
KRLFLIRVPLTYPDMLSTSLFLMLALISAVSCKVTVNGKETTATFKYEYLNHSVTPTRNEGDIQTCLKNGMKDGTTFINSINCKQVTYSFGATAPCANGQASTKDPGSPQAMSCSSTGKSQTCYQMSSSTFTNAFSTYTGATKPNSISWQCTGKDEFCCGFECCKKRSTKWIWILVVVLLLVFVGLPCIGLAICCCFCGLFAKCMSMVCKKGSSPPPQNNQVQDYRIEPRFNNGSYNTPPRAMY